MWRPTWRLSFFAHGWRLSQDGGESTECTSRLNEGGQLCPLLHRLFSMKSLICVLQLMWSQKCEEIIFRTPWTGSCTPRDWKVMVTFSLVDMKLVFYLPSIPIPLEAHVTADQRAWDFIWVLLPPWGTRSWARELGRLSPWPPYSSSFRSYVDPPGLLQVRSRRWGILCLFQRL